MSSKETVSTEKMTPFEQAQLALMERQAKATEENNRLLARTLDPALIASDGLESMARTRKNLDGNRNWVATRRGLYHVVHHVTVDAVIVPRADHPTGVLFNYAQGIKLDPEVTNRGLKLAAEGAGDAKRAEAVLLAMQRGEAQQDPDFAKWLQSDLSLVDIERRIESASEMVGKIVTEIRKRFLEWRVSEVLLPVRRLIGQPWSEIAPQFRQPWPKLVILDSGKNSRFPVPEGATVESS